MAEDYQPNVSGIMTPLAASQLGTQQSNNAINIKNTNQTQAADIQQKMAQTQSLQQQIAQKQQENHDAMVNHVGQAFNELATWDDVSSPMWKYKFNDTIKNAQHLGFDMDPDAMKAFLTSDDTRSKFASAFGKLSDPSVSPNDRASALKDAVQATGSDPSAIAKLADNLADSATKLLVAKSKNGSSLEGRAKEVRTQVGKINSKWDATSQFSDTANSILSNYDKKDADGKPIFSTGQAEVALKDAYNKALSGGAPRSFTLAMMDENRGVGDKLDGYFQKLNSGQKLQPDERKDMLKAVQIQKQDADRKRDMEIQPYYNVSKSLLNTAKMSGYDLQPNQLIPEEQWNKLSDRENGVTFNSDTGKYETNAQPSAPAPKKSGKAPKQAPSNDNAPSLGKYQAGMDRDQDNFLKGTISHGATLGQINKILLRYGKTIDPIEYQKLGGTQ